MTKDIEILRRSGTPFRTTAVAGPYEQGSDPFDEHLVGQPLRDLDLAFAAADRLSSPLLPLVGDVGVGKTALLRYLVRKNHEKRSRFLVPVAPAAVAASPAVDAANITANVLWQATAAALMQPGIPGFGALRPVDIYAARTIDRVAKTAEDNNQPLLMTRKWWQRRRPLPEKLLDPTLSQRLDQVSPAHNPTMAAVLAARIREDFGETHQPQLRCWLMGRALGVDVDAVPGDTPGECLARFAALSRKLEMPLVLLFDQLEDLSMLSGDQPAAVRNLFLHLLDFDRHRRQFWPWCSPLLLVSMSFEVYDDLISHAHIKDRLSILPHGKQYIYFDKMQADLQQQEKAINLLNLYLGSHLSKIERGNPKFQRPHDIPHYPFTDTDLKLMHRVLLKTDRSPTIRRWLVLCNEGWEWLVFRNDTEPLEERRKLWQKELKRRIKEQLKAQAKPDNETEEPDKDSGPEGRPPYDLSFFITGNEFGQACQKLWPDNSEEQLLRLVVEALADSGTSLPPAGDIYLRFTSRTQVICAAVTFRSNRGGGCANAWQQFLTHLQSQQQHRVLFLRTADEEFSQVVTPHVDKAPVITHYLGEADMRYTCALLVLRESDRVRELPRPSWYKSGEDFTPEIEALLEQWPLYGKLRAKS